MRHGWRRVLIACVWVWLGACAVERPPLWESDNPIQPLPPPPIGVSGRLTQLAEPPTPERIRLGRWLFFDERLSAGKARSCASCHRPELAYGGPPSPASGPATRRRPPALVNLAWASAPTFDWDGRAASLEAQILGAGATAGDPDGAHGAQPMARAAIGLGVYNRYFQEAFGTPAVTPERIAKALADFVRSCLSGDSPWDQWKRAGDQTAATPAAKAGDALFFRKAGCAACHAGDTLTDGRFHILGVGWDDVRRAFRDDGRFGVTGMPADRGAFRTPTLRDVGRHPPFMHDGSASTLRQAIAMHRGGRAIPGVDPLLDRAPLSESQMSDLVAFLESLSSPQPAPPGPASFPK